ncbi:MAG: export transporter periplasmic protein LptC [Pseudomonadota bacterium]|jgi:lipopolysaccharide export system protein LptC
MARRAALDGWSRLVAWLKVVLPLAALALLSTLFLISNRINPEDAIPYAEVDVEARLKEPRMTAPTYAGTTKDGAALEVSAAETRPAVEGARGQTAKDVAARLSTPDGAVTDLDADGAEMALDGTEMTFRGNVVVTNSIGYRVETETLLARLDRTDLRSPTPVRVDGPVGRITADSMRLSPAGDGGTSYLLVFNGRVKLVYRPAG